ncbi:5808_t:CDS:1 [Acaulospora morrowiae]|uniref:5808_t:CDS:1 n=1 Tax=Acaulospora morrowiae TaxID=94023 RepID=A0A9N9DUD1_9GLOM|nr:5808_t:CDS:1 [Acaulospora morrowiae]
MDDEKSGSSLKQQAYFTYSWKICNLKEQAKNLNTGKCFYSPDFWVPFHRGDIKYFGEDKSTRKNCWRLKMFPNGDNKDRESYMSTFLEAVQTTYEKSNNISIRHQRFALILKTGNCSGGLKDKFTPSTLTNYHVIKNASFSYKKGHDWGFGKFYPLNKILIDNGKSSEVNIIVDVQFFLDEDIETTNVCYYEEYFSNEKFSDVEFILDSGDRIKAHRIILSSKSPYFKAMFEGEWIESKLQVIPIKNVEFDTFRRILYHFYSGKFKEEIDLKQAIDLFKLAVMLDVISLQNFALRKLVDMINLENWEEVLDFGLETDELVVITGVFNMLACNWEGVVNQEILTELEKRCDSKYWVDLMEMVKAVNW